MEKLTSLRKSDPSNLLDFPDFVYHKASVLGKGSYGKVYSGWLKPSGDEVAVKMVKAEFYENDAKVRENLYREVDIQEDLKECPHVVRLHSRLERADGLYLVMEKCDYDLQHHLNVVKALNEAATKDFLFQLGGGIEFMHKLGIVHRDLKPANILLVRDGAGGVVVKLADFGFARHFRKGEGTKPMDMTSLAGTPVYMAPEALDCVFYKGKRYDETVDMWSTGAVLYQCLVGRPPFYAQLQDILPILKKKGEAIAFKRGRSGQIQYMKELPSDVDSRLSKRFKQQMNTLLRQLLQVSPSKRLSYDEFFSFVNQLNSTPLDIYCPTTGAKHTVPITVDTPCNSIGGLISSATGIPPQDQIVYDLGTGIEINTLSTDNLPGAILQKTDQWAFVVLSKQQLLSEEPPSPDEEYVQELMKILEDPGRAVGVVQAEGLSVMCGEVVESANEIHEVTATALMSYRKIVQNTQQLLYDVRTDLRMEKGRYKSGCGALLDISDEDLGRAVEGGMLTSERQRWFQQKLKAMKDCHTAVLRDADICEEQCTSSYESMVIEDDIQSMRSVRGDLTPLMEECRRITRFKGQLMVSSTKALVMQCRQRHTAFLKSVHEKFRSLFHYAHAVPKFESRVQILASRCSTAWEDIKKMRRTFATDLFLDISQSDSGSGFTALCMPSRNVSPPSITESLVGMGTTSEVETLQTHNSELQLDKLELLKRVDELEQQLKATSMRSNQGRPSVTTSPPEDSSVWQVVGASGLTVNNMAGTFPTNVLPVDGSTAQAGSRPASPFSIPSNEVEHTLIPGAAPRPVTPTMSGAASPNHTRAPQSQAQAPAQAAPLSPGQPAAPVPSPRSREPAPRRPNLRDELNLEEIRLAIAQFLGLTQKLQEIVSYQPAGDKDNEFDLLAGDESAGGASIMDTWRAATDGVASMLGEKKLIESIQTMVSLSQFVERDRLKTAVRAMAKQISYKSFAQGQVVLFLAVAKKGIYSAFTDRLTGSSASVRYYLRTGTITDNKPQWALGFLTSAPKLEKAQDTRNPYNQPKYSQYYVMDARIYLYGDL